MKNAFEKENEFPNLPAGYERPKVVLVGVDGNVFNIIGQVIKAIVRHEKSRMYQTEARAFQKYATSGDYDKALRAAMHWTEVS